MLYIYNVGLPTVGCSGLFVPSGNVFLMTKERNNGGLNMEVDYARLGSCKINCNEDDKRILIMALGIMNQEMRECGISMCQSLLYTRHF